MSGVDDVDAVAAPVPDGGKESGGEQLSVRQPAAQPLHRHLDAFLRRRLLDEAHERLDVRAEPDLVGGDGWCRRAREAQCR